MSYLDELYRARADKAGIVYIDIWDGFVDDQGRYVQDGPDFEGQTRRLRTYDGVYLTKAVRGEAWALYRTTIYAAMLSSHGLPVALPTPGRTITCQRCGRSGPASKRDWARKKTASFWALQSNQQNGKLTHLPRACSIAVMLLLHRVVAPTHFSWPRGDPSSAPEEELSIAVTPKVPPGTEPASD